MDNMDKNIMDTVKFKVEAEHPLKPREILLCVNEALAEKGYNPTNQIVGYILSGDPSYITAHNNARSLIRKLERDEILEELVNFYIAHSDEQ